MRFGLRAMQAGPAATPLRIPVLRARFRSSNLLANDWISRLPNGALKCPTGAKARDLKMTYGTTAQPQLASLGFGCSSRALIPAVAEARGVSSPYSSNQTVTTPGTVHRQRPSSRSGISIRRPAFDLSIHGLDDGAGAQLDFHRIGNHRR